MSRKDVEVTELLHAWIDGDASAAELLMASIYSQLSGMASGFLRGERSGHTLDTGALVNEAFLRLVDQKRVRYNDRVHFLSVAARMMRRVLIDHARRSAYAKRGGGTIHLTSSQIGDASPRRAEELIALDDALKDLEKQDPEMAQIVVQKYFGGLRNEELAEVLGVSLATIKRRWRMAKSWLYLYLQPNPPEMP